MRPSAEPCWLSMTRSDKQRLEVAVGLVNDALPPRSPMLVSQVIGVF
jgi:hypothetical protein